jgi:hypothetical protein
MFVRNRPVTVLRSMPGDPCTGTHCSTVVPMMGCVQQAAFHARDRARGPLLPLLASANAPCYRSDALIFASIAAPGFSSASPS